eukprot:gene8974-12106_t
MVCALPKALFRRHILAVVASVLLVATTGTEAALAEPKAQASARVRVAVTSVGAAAIERTRQRLAFAYSDLGLTLGTPVYFRLIREQDRLEVWAKAPSGAYSRLRNFKICSKDGALGPRQNTSSGQPEGFYTITASQMRPQGVGYLGINLNWPNAYDRGRGWRGAPSLLQAWLARRTQLAAGRLRLRATLRVNRSRYGRSLYHRLFGTGQGPKASFWRDLEPAWRAFERTKTSPQIKVQGRRYRVSESK